jgi:hypothetical protein
MPKFRPRKRELRGLLLRDNWREVAERLLDIPGLEAVSPLLSFLCDGGLLKWRAVQGLGLVVGRLAEEDTEAARTVLRRLMWSLNEDSGNMGWGMAESMGEILAATPRLAGEYGRILLSYARETDTAGNYIEHGPLRRGVYWGIGRLALEYAPLRPPGAELLAKGLRDSDVPARGVAAWALGRLALLRGFVPEERAALGPALRALAAESAGCEVLEGETIRTASVAVLAGEAMAALSG